MPIVAEALKTLRLLGGEMWRRWYVVIGTMLVCAVLVIAYSRSRPPQYTVSMIVAPAESGGGGGLSGAMGALGGGGGGLLSLVGGGRSPQFDHYVMLLQSQSISESLMKDKRFMTLLFRKAIDPQTGAWKNGITRRLKNGLFSLFGVTRPDRPTVDDVQFMLNSLLVVDMDPLNKTQAAVRCTSSVADMCRDLMLAVHEAAQARLDKIAVDNAQRTASYLSQVVSTVNEVSVRQALTSALTSNQIEAAITNIGQNRVVILDTPVIPSAPSFPKPVLLLEFAIFVGFLLGAAITWLLRDKEFGRARFSREFEHQNTR